MPPRKRAYRLRRTDPALVAELGRELTGGTGPVNVREHPDYQSLASELTKSTDECGQVKEALIRLRADMENLRKRAAREKDQMRAQAIEDLLKDLIPVLDNFERALASVANAKNLKAVTDGVQMIYQQFFDKMVQRGVERVDTVGVPFDPNVHEAVTTIPPKAGEPEGQVVDVLQSGFLLNKRVVRPAMVRITKNP